MGRRRCPDRLGGGRADGRCPSDFDPEQLRIGTKVELEHTSDRRLAREIAMDHLTEHPRYYDHLEVAEDRMARGVAPNRRRIRVYDAAKMARNMRGRFQGVPSSKRLRFAFDWPEHWQNVGDSLAVAYSSDKRAGGGDGVMKPWKHLAESRNRALVQRGLIHDYHAPNERWQVRGPLVSFTDVPMPRHFAVLALFEEVDLKLYTAGSDQSPRFGRSRDAGVVKATVKHGMLGGGEFQWAKVDDEREDQPFLFVYTEDDGPVILIVGDELCITEHGIEG